MAEALATRRYTSQPQIGTSVRSHIQVVVQACLAGNQQSVEVDQLPRAAVTTRGRACMGDLDDQKLTAQIHFQHCALRT
jgi:hypothetical protein